MVKERAFSFSDDSANVALPSTLNTLKASTTTGRDQLFLRTLDPAICLFRIRRLQSAWYHELFLSGRTAWADPEPYLWAACHDTRKWFEDLPSSIPPPIRRKLELEALYSYIYVLSPSGKVHNVPVLGQSLVFEYSMEYTEKMQNVLRDMDSSAIYTFHDILRVYFVGRRFLDVLWQNQDRLLSGVIFDTPDVPPGLLAPLSVTNRSRQSITSRAIQCINGVIEILETFGHKSGYMSLRDRFSADSKFLLDELHTRLRGLHQAAGRSNLGYRRRTEGVLDLEANAREHWETENTRGFQNGGPRSQSYQGR